MSQKLAPVPIRRAFEWDQLTTFNEMSTPEIVDMLRERAKINCRECFGFGHTRTNCPTRYRLKQLALMNAGLKSFVGNYRAAMCKAQMQTFERNTNPFTVCLNIWRDASVIADQKDRDIVTVAINTINTECAYICFTCSGFGHVYTDFQFNKKGKHIPTCPTQPHIDLAFKYCTDRPAYVKFKGLFFKRRETMRQIPKPFEEYITGYKRSFEVSQLGLRPAQPSPPPMQQSNVQQNNSPLPNPTVPKQSVQGPQPIANVIQNQQQILDQIREDKKEKYVRKTLKNIEESKDEKPDVIMATTTATTKLAREMKNLQSDNFDELEVDETVRIGKLPIVIQNWSRKYYDDSSMKNLRHVRAFFDLLADATTADGSQAGVIAYGGNSYSVEYSHVDNRIYLRLKKNSEVKKAPEIYKDAGRLLTALIRAGFVLDKDNKQMSFRDARPKSERGMRAKGSKDTELSETDSIQTLQTYKHGDEGPPTMTRNQSESSITRMLEAITLSQSSHLSQQQMPTVDDLREILLLPRHGCDLDYYDLEKIKELISKVVKQSTDIFLVQVAKQALEHLTAVMANGVTRLK